MPELGAQTLLGVRPRSSPAPRTSIPRRAPPPCGARSTPPTRRGEGPGPLFSAGFLEARGSVDRGRDERRALRLPPVHRGELFGDGTHAGRNRQRLGRCRRPRLERDRSGGHRPHRGAEGRGEPESAGHRAGALHGGARAAGRQRPRAAARSRAQRAYRRRRAAARSRSPAAARASASRWWTRGSRSTRIQPIRGSSVSRSTARGCRSDGWCGSRRASSAISPTAGSGPQKTGRQPTGPPQAGGLALTGGTKTTEELIAGCERGILVTHFFYIRSLEPRTVLQTGLTRDGTFLIENGKITRSLKNFRWNESPLLMLNRLEDIGRPEPVGRRAADAGAPHQPLRLQLALRRGLSRSW